jgi:protein-S-isoprenylcysteine O-methyltransferase Ste14
MGGVCPFLACGCVLAGAGGKAAGVTPDVWVYRLLLVAGLVLLNHRASFWLHAHRLFPVGRTGAYGLAVLMVPGFAFAWWARLHLGRLWSSGITTKTGHEVVASGPYRLVRHPIYTGILFACLCSAVVQATWVSFLAFAVILAGFYVKARGEEAFLAESLPQGEYAAYRARVPMLVPGL